MIIVGKRQMRHARGNLSGLSWLSYVNMTSVSRMNRAYKMYFPQFFISNTTSILVMVHQAAKLLCWVSLHWCRAYGPGAGLCTVWICCKRACVWMLWFRCHRLTYLSCYSCVLHLFHKIIRFLRFTGKHNYPQGPILNQLLDLYFSLCTPVGAAVHN